MPTKNVAYRIATSGKQDVVRDFNEIGQAADNTGKQMTQSFQRAGTASEAMEQRYLRLAAAAKQSVMQSVNQANFNHILGVDPNTAKSAKDSARILDDMIGRTTALRAAINPLGAAQEKMNSEIANANDLFARGAITVEEQAAAHALAKTRFDATAKSLGAVAGEAGLSSFQLANLGFQFNDVVTGLAMGQRPLQVLAQQGGQVYQVFAGSNVSVTTALKQVTDKSKAMVSGLMNMVTPARLVGGAFGLVAVTGVAAFAQTISREKELEAATRGLGRVAGVTAVQLLDMARAGAQFGDTSVSAAIATEKALLSTGKVYKENFAGLIGIAKNFAAQTGLSADDANKALAKMAADPVKGINALGDAIGGVTAAEVERVQSLVAQGREQDAVNVLIATAKRNLVDYRNELSLTGRVMNSFGQIGSTVWDDIKEGIEGSFTALKKFENEHPAVANAITSAMTAALPPEFRLILEHLLNPPTAAPTSTNVRGVDQTRDAVIAASRNVGTDAISSLLDASAARKKALDNATGATPSQLATMTLDYQRMKSALDSLSDSQGTLIVNGKHYLSQQQIQQRQDELNIRAINARTPAEKAQIASEQAKLSLTGQMMTAEERNTAATLAGSAAYIQSAKVIIDQNRVLDIQATGALKVAAAWQQGAAAAALAEAKRQALTEQVQTGIDADQRAAQIVRQQVASQITNSAQTIAQMMDETAIRKRMNDAIGTGILTLQQADEQMQTELGLRPLLIAQALAEGDAKKKLADEIKSLTQAYASDNQERARSAALAEFVDQGDQITLLRREIQLQGLSADARDIELAKLNEVLRLKRMGVDLTEMDSQAWVENAENIERMHQALSLANAEQQEISGTVDDLGNSLQDFFNNGEVGWKSLGDLGLSVIKDLESELIKLSLINPFKSWLTGEKLPGLGGVLGQLLGSIGGSGGIEEITMTPDVFGRFHTGGTAGYASSFQAVKADLFRNARRYHSGGLAGDEVPAILQRGERVLSLQETKNYRNNRSGDASGAVTVNYAPVYNIQGSDRAQVQAMIDERDRRNKSELYGTVTSIFIDARRRRML